MDMLSVLVVFLAEFLIGLFGAKWAFSVADKMGSSDGEGFSFPLGVVLLLASFVCIALVFSNHLGGPNSFFFYAVMAMGLIVMVLKDIKLPALSYALSLVGICWVSSYFLPSSVSIAGGFMGVLTHIGLAFEWATLVWLFVQMDRVPFVSMTLSLIFTIFYFLLSGLLDMFEPAFGYLSITLAVVLLGVNSYLKRGRYPQLGKIAATFIGFIWGAMATYIMASGHITAIVVLYSYPIMEVVLSTLVSIALYQRFLPVYPFLIEQVIANKPQPEKALKFIMRWECLIACLAVLAVMNKDFPISTFYIALGFFSVNIYMRLKSWGEPTVRLRDVFKDVKEGIGQVKVEIKKMADNQKQKKQMTSAKNQKATTDTPQDVKKEKRSVKTKTAPRKKTVTKTLSDKKTTPQRAKKSPKTKRGG